MTLGEALHLGRDALSRAQRPARLGDPEARLEAEALLRHVLGYAPAQIYARWEEPLRPEALTRFLELLGRCRAGEPLAYLVGQREFYGLPFFVDQGVFIPRPETELVVEVALGLARSLGPRQTSLAIADVGTGCGNIAICLARGLPQARLYAIDLSPQALEVAEQNCRRHQVSSQVILVSGDLLEPLPERVDLMVANLPYVPSAEARGKRGDRSVTGEPLLALDGGPNGVVLVQRCLGQAPHKLKAPGALVLEIGAGQAGPLRALAACLFPQATVSLIPDLAGHQRVLTVRLPAESLVNAFPALGLEGEFQGLPTIP